MSNLAESLPNLADSMQGLAGSFPNITEKFPNLAGYLANITDSFPNIGIAGYLQNISRAWPNLTDVIQDTIDGNQETALAIPFVGDVETDVIDEITGIPSETPVNESISTVITSGMTTAKPEITDFVKNVSTTILSTVAVVNDSVIQNPNFNSTTMAPTKEPVKTITTLWSSISTTISSYNGTELDDINSTTTSESACGSGYTVDECEWVVNFERILSPILMVLIIIGLVANIYIVYTVVARKDMRTFSNLFMTNLSATHLIFLVVIGATDVYDYVLTVRDIAHSSVIPSSVHLYISLVITNCDVSMLTALSIDRYVAISVDPKKVAKYSKVKITTGVCALVWIASLAVCAPVFYSIDTTNGTFDISESSFKVAMSISFVVSYIIPLTVITVVYFAIRRKLRKRSGESLRVKKDGVVVTRTPEEYRLYHDQQILRSILVIVLLYTFNFGARYITKMIIYLSIPFGRIAIFVATQLSETAAILTASLQPIVYVMLHPTFSKHTRERFACSGGTKSFGCCVYCGKCYIACCTCCGLINLSPVPQPSLRGDGDVGSRQSKKIDRVILVENMELDIIPPPPSPTSRNPSSPTSRTSPSPSTPQNSNSPPPSSSPAYIPHASSPSFPPLSPTDPSRISSSSSPPSHNHIPSPPSYPPPSPPYPHAVLFFPFPRPSSPPCLDCEEPY
ncbi:uncharacterized protein LOC135155671 [Lytechinus pictus]|uniref:uncharacterized protein LOC135155671 n=1 Tax=Lytechinus pictus TaxID=7653 RepID=UPI0030B9B650